MPAIYPSIPILSEKNDVYHKTDFLIPFYACFEFVFVPYQTATVEFILLLKQTPLKMAPIPRATWKKWAERPLTKRIPGVEGMRRLFASFCEANVQCGFGSTKIGLIFNGTKVYCRQFCDRFILIRGYCWVDLRLKTQSRRHLLISSPSFS
ncbi:hypothetical protein XBO1_290108 [Xenorhabdus bovienii str. oregonense]|uniref:Uncharacterized protein n=1 Tax=Xenorhabdus bovienii str. oregonense TaxID=1398202 RepID=A0A077P8Q5_XENBV|nr:hypothetical protein XBO1_290108 [Xenorhabdus bovienii str. oregonense]